MTQSESHSKLARVELILASAGNNASCRASPPLVILANAFPRPLAWPRAGPVLRAWASGRSRCPLPLRRRWCVFAGDFGAGGLLLVGFDDSGDAEELVARL